MFRVLREKNIRKKQAITFFWGKMKEEIKIKIKKNNYFFLCTDLPEELILWFPQYLFCEPVGNVNSQSTQRKSAETLPALNVVMQSKGGVSFMHFRFRFVFGYRELNNELFTFP